MSLHELDAEPTIEGPHGFVRGTILISPGGYIKVLRTRTHDDDGWNCQDGAPISDDEAGNPELWTPYTESQLMADLALARDVRELGGLRELGGGLATWDACSGRPCILPKLARLIHHHERRTREPRDWMPVDVTPLEPL